jgi:hypothetical protein
MQGHNTPESRIRFVPNYDHWEPPAALLELLPSLPLVRDRVEAVIAFYCADHGGQGPFAREIAEVLHIAKQNVERRMNELIAEGRARRHNGKYMLCAAHYQHPALAPVDSDLIPHLQTPSEADSSKDAA